MKQSSRFVTWQRVLTKTDARSFSNRLRHMHSRDVSCRKKIKAIDLGSFAVWSKLFLSHYIFLDYRFEDIKVSKKSEILKPSF